MATLEDLKPLIETSGYEAVRVLPISGMIATTVVFRDDNGYYCVAEPDGRCKKCWLDWTNALSELGESWAMAEDWIGRGREDGDDLLTLQYVAKRLSTSDDTVRRWCEAGTIEAVTLPSAGKNQAYRIRRRVLAALLAGRKAAPGATVEQAS